jgi:hypothetical protein
MQGYWGNYDSTIDKAEQLIGQVCTYDNCRSFEYAKTSDLNVTSKKCKTCWTQDDLLDYGKWDARSSYPEQSLKALEPTIPFVLSGGECRLRCRAWYWSNFGSFYNSTTDANAQVCTYMNCKAWNYTELHPTRDSKHCTQCWSGSDVDNYPSWDGKGPFSEEDIKGRDPETPFVLNSDGVCELQCKPGWWTNWDSTVNAVTDPHAQKCTYDNCKSYDSGATDASSDNCKTCWSRNDVDNPKWAGRHSYTKAEISSEKAHGEPFILEIDPQTGKGQCVLKCKGTYWSNHKSGSGKAVDMNDQRCTYSNCKAWDHESPTGYSWFCTACWDKSDLARADWQAKSTYTELELEGVDLEQPFVLDKITGECILQCKSGYWSNYKSTQKAADYPTSQRCYNNNCKDFNSDKTDGGNNSTICIECWGNHDIAAYNTWSAAPSYPSIVLETVS